MESKTRHWAFAFVVSLAVHTGVVGALVAALPAGSLPKPKPVGNGSGSVTGVGPMRVQLVGTSSRADLPPSNGLSERAEMRSKAHPRRQARAATIKPMIQETDAELRGSDDQVKSGSSSTETGSAEFDAALDSTSMDSSAAGSRSEGTSSGLQVPSSGMSDRLAELHRRLADSARRCYPGTARRLRLRGEVGLHFCLSEEGRADAATLHGSTGSALLDLAARECVLAGALPARGITGCYDVPIKFSDGE
jgi:TonB family protein